MPCHHQFAMHAGNALFLVSDNDRAERIQDTHPFQNNLNSSFILSQTTLTLIKFVEKIYKYINI
jgi:hypothetical protein